MKFDILQEEFAGVVVQDESLRGWNITPLGGSPFEARESTQQMDELFESLLSQSFGGA